MKLNYYYIVWTKILQTETTPGEERLLLQSTRKIECKAHVEMKSYPEFAISQAEREGLSKWKLMYLQEEKIKMIKENIEAKRTVETTIYFFSLPSDEAHSAYATGQAGVYAQKLHPEKMHKKLWN